MPPDLRPDARGLWLIELAKKQESPPWQSIPANKALTRPVVVEIGNDAEIPDDRVKCEDCRNLSKGTCKRATRYRPHETILRHCRDYQAAD